MSRTIVVSDLHGRSHALQSAVDNAGFREGDTLVVAGDLIDVGPDDTIALAETYGAVILAGNHEVAAALGLRIAPQHPESLARGPEFAERMISGAWRLAHVADGHLITHAGVSTALSDLIAAHTDDLPSFADDLNARFAEEVAAALPSAPLRWDDLERFRLIGSPLGPLWFRPFSVSQLPSGIRQIVGHTAPELLPGDLAAAVRSAGWTLVEPGGHGPGEDGVNFRYAIVEDGRATVVEG